MFRRPCMKTIFENRLQVEKKLGKSITIYSAYPLIGRGSVQHNMVSHEEVERRFQKALKVSFWQRLVFFINRLLSNV